MTKEELKKILERFKHLAYTDDFKGMDRARENEEAINMVLELIDRVDEVYHDFCGYDLAKCGKYGNETYNSFAPLMMYEIASEYERLLDWSEEE